MSTNPRKSSPTLARALSIEDLALKSGIASEHVVLSGDEPATPQRVRSNAIRQRLRLHNRATRSVTIIRIFRDGYASIGRHRRGKCVDERTIDLRVLDPNPRLSRYIARTTLRIVLACIALALFSAPFTYLSILPIVSWTVTAVAVVAAIAASVVFVRRSRERIEFRTLHGRAIVLTLIANIGSVRSYRKAVPKLIAAIREAHREDTGDKQLRLRAEMREHYRLAAAGILSDEACTTATRRILERF